MDDKEYVSRLREKFFQDFGQHHDVDWKHYAKALESMLYVRGRNTLDENGWNQKYGQFIQRFRIYGSHPQYTSSTLVLTIMAPSANGQASGFSIRQQEFNSPWGYKHMSFVWYQ